MASYDYLEFLGFEDCYNYLKDRDVISYKLENYRNMSLFVDFLLEQIRTDKIKPYFFYDSQIEVTLYNYDKNKNIVDVKTIKFYGYVKFFFNHYENFFSKLRENNRMKFKIFHYIAPYPNNEIIKNIANETNLLKQYKILNENFTVSIYDLFYLKSDVESILHIDDKLKESQDNKTNKKYEKEVELAKYIWSQDISNVLYPIDVAIIVKNVFGHWQQADTIKDWINTAIPPIVKDKNTVKRNSASKGQAKLLILELTEKLKQK